MNSVTNVFNKWKPLYISSNNLCIHSNIHICSVIAERFKVLESGSNLHYISIPQAFGQFTHALVSLYSLYGWTIIKYSMHVVDNFHIKTR